MIDRLQREDLVDDREVPPTERFLKDPEHYGLVSLFGSHVCFLLFFFVVMV